MAWKLLPINYTDASWEGLKKYKEQINGDGSKSFLDITDYHNKENSFFGAKDANQMNEAINTIMSMLENGTDLYTAFQNYFSEQKSLFENSSNLKSEEFKEYLNNLKTSYNSDLETFKQNQKEIFDNWFSLLKNQLSGDVAANLATQTQENKTKIDSNTQAITENAESIRQLNANVGQLNEEKIKQLAGENIFSISHTFTSVNYDDNNLYNAVMNIDANSGILAWANWSHSFYKIEKQNGKVIFYANADFNGKKINYVLFKNSNFIEFIGTVEKQTEIILQTNSENKAELVTKTYTQGSITFKTDRVEARYGGAGGRELIATKPIDLSRFSRIRMYGRFVLESPDAGEVYAGYFGVIKPETVNNLALNPNSSFLASKRISGINSTGYLEIDISNITGEYNVGAFGYSQWDTYRFEILK